MKLFFHPLLQFNTSRVFHLCLNTVQYSPHRARHLSGAGAGAVLPSTHSPDAPLLHCLAKKFFHLVKGNYIHPVIQICMDGIRNDH